MKIGDTVSFGPFEWYNLDIDGENILILTKDIIEVRDYHDKYIETTWEKSNVREYLNGEFLNHFTQKESEQILETLTINSNNPWYESNAGNDTYDHVFLLSLDEVVCQYFGDSGHVLDNVKRYWFQSKDANNILRRAQYLKEPWWWWTRTPGRNNKVAVYIHGDGNVGIQGNGVGTRKVNVIHPINKESQGGIRPAMWIRIQE